MASSGAPGALFALVAAAVTLRGRSRRWRSPGPGSSPDEMAYALPAADLWHHGDLAVLGGPSQYTSALYPALAGLPLLGGLHAGYAVLRVLQAVAMCSTGSSSTSGRGASRGRGGRSPPPRSRSRCPAACTRARSSPRRCFVPLATLAGWLAVRALEDPTRRKQALLVLALVACLLTRGEANMLALALVVAARHARRVRALAPTWIALVFARVYGSVSAAARRSARSGATASDPATPSTASSTSCSNTPASSCS